MATLFFDIETIPLIDTVEPEDALSPATAAVKIVSLYDLERDIGSAYIVGDTSIEELGTEKCSVRFASEKELLLDFWQGTTSYDIFVGFGTRRFDVPFLIHRSLAHDIAPSTRLVNRKHISQQSLPFHVDLFDEFSFYGAMSRPLSLAALGQLYATSSAVDILTYEDACEILATDRYDSLLRHTKAKVETTVDLYRYCQNYLAPPNFLNTIEL